MDSGRFYVDSTGNVVKQTIKKCPGVIGAATRGDIGLLQKLPVSKLKDVDGFGRTPVMLAARYNNWQALIFLLQQPGIEWQQVGRMPALEGRVQNFLSRAQIHGVFCREPVFLHDEGINQSRLYCKM